MSSSDHSINSIKNAFQLLDLLSVNNGSLSVSQMAEILDVSPSTITRILQTMSECGWADKSSHTNKYFLSNHCYTFTNRLINSNRFIQKYLPVAHLIAQKYSIIIDLDSMFQKQTVLLHRLALTYDKKLSYHTGEGIPAYCSSAGKAILAMYSEEELDQYFSDLDIIKYQPNTYDSESRIRSALLKIREKGYAISNEEFQEGLISISFPIKDKYAQYYAFTLVSTPKNKRLFSDPATIDYVRKKLNEINFY